ncbi:hypothetical protein HK414_22050 [Ramlibacter terrae]|uniref:Integrase n=1 Tax=Ramlibacter terrae TaxID=2732511 RepID=A0ABX6P726_9BURK|nr:hypothetical protein HK414_22050 [Ramlibacter terrae]
MPYVDMVHILGDSHLLDADDASAGEKAVQDALGHTTLRTTVAYTVPKEEALARTFTSTSRNAKVLALVDQLEAGDRRNAIAEGPVHVPAPVAPTPEVLALARAFGTYDETFGSL